MPDHSDAGAGIGALQVRTSVSRSELLIHAADVEGLCRGVDQDLVQRAYPSLTQASASGCRFLQPMRAARGVRIGV